RHVFPVGGEIGGALDSADELARDRGDGTTLAFCKGLEGGMMLQTSLLEGAGSSGSEARAWPTLMRCWTKPGPRSLHSRKLLGTTWGYLAPLSTLQLYELFALCLVYHLQHEEHREDGESGVQRVGPCQSYSCQENREGYGDREVGQPLSEARDGEA